MEKHPTTGSFNLQNISSQDYHRMIQSEDFPSSLTASQKERIKELYSKGHTFDAVRKLANLMQGTKPGKTTL